MLILFALLFAISTGDVSAYPRPRQLVNVDISIVDHALINDHSDLSDIALPGKLWPLLRAVCRPF